MILNENIEEKWLDYKEDESYLLRYVSPDKLREFTDKEGNIQDASGLVDFCIGDWKGIFKKENNKQVKLKCTRENKILLCDASPSRWGWIMAKCVNYSTFFDMEAHLKN